LDVCISAIDCLWTCLQYDLLCVELDIKDDRPNQKFVLRVSVCMYQYAADAVAKCRPGAACSTWWQLRTARPVGDVWWCVGDRCSNVLVSLLLLVDGVLHL